MWSIYYTNKAYKINHNFLSQYSHIQDQWEYQSDGGKFDRYGPEINAKIEAAYLKNNKGSVEWEEENGLYRIDFDKMRETQVGNSKSILVQRLSFPSM